MQKLHNLSCRNDTDTICERWLGWKTTHKSFIFMTMHIEKSSMFLKYDKKSPSKRVQVKQYHQHMLKCS